MFVPLSQPCTIGSTKLTPYHEKRIAEKASTPPQLVPNVPTQPANRPCRTTRYAKSEINAQTSFGSQSQKRPHETSAQRPPRMVPAARSSTATCWALYV